MGAHQRISLAIETCAEDEVRDCQAISMCRQLSCDDDADEEDYVLCELCCESAGGLRAWQKADGEARALLIRHQAERPKCRIERFCPGCILTYVHTWEDDPRRQREKQGCLRNGYCCPLCRFELRMPSLQCEIVRAAKRFQLDVAQFEKAILTVNGKDPTSARRMLQALLQASERRNHLINAVSNDNNTEHQQESASFEPWLQDSMNHLHQDMRTLGVLLKKAP